MVGRLPDEAGMKIKKYRDLRAIYSRFRQRNIFMLAAGVSFYAFLSLFPFFILVIFVSSLFFKDTVVIENIQRYIRIFPADVADVFQGNLIYILENSEFISIISFLFLLYFAFKIFSGIELALNNLYGATGIRSGWFGKLRAFVFFLLSSLVLILLFLSGNLFLVLTTKIEKLTLMKSFYLILLGDVLVVTLFFSLSYKFLSFRKIRFKDALIGAAVAAVLWEIMKNVYGLYISSISRYVLLYGTIGSIVFLLVWIYYSVLIFLFGAEICFEINSGRLQMKQ